MIRYVEQTTQNRHRVLHALVGLGSAIAPSTSEPNVSPGSAIGSSKNTYSMFDKFGKEQEYLSTETKYMILIHDGRIIPLIVDSYDPKNDVLKYFQAHVKSEHQDKVRVELSRLAEHLKIATGGLVIELDPNERDMGAASRNIIDSYNRTGAVTYPVS